MNCFHQTVLILLILFIITNKSQSTVENKNITVVLSHKSNETVVKVNSVQASRNITQTSRGNIPPSAQPVNETVSKYFYIYDLPKPFWWRWPVPGTEQRCHEQGYLGHSHALNSALGKLINLDDGLFLTWHFSMFNSLYNRLKRSRFRTYDPEKASVFIIPYDIGLDGYMDANTCVNRMKCSEGLVGQMTKVLQESKYFHRHGGADHVILWSLGQYHPWPRAGCDMFMKDFCAKCTLTCYWMDPTKAENRFISMPFPAGYHWWDGIKNIPWDVNNSDKRNMTAVYLGSIQTLNPAHTKIRRAMTNQCNTSSECHWLRISHSSIDSQIADLLSVYKRAKFCLCPPGDDPARKAVFDAIVSGCIPVIFEVATLYNQYPWHIGERAALDVSVYIPGGLVRANKVNFMEILLSIKPEVIRKKQLAIAQLAPRLQFATPPIENLQQLNDTTPWDPPFMDAAEIAIHGFFDRVDDVLNNRSTGIPHRLMAGREWGQEYSVVKVKVPHGDLKFGREVNKNLKSIMEESIPEEAASMSTNNPQGNSNTHHGRHGGKKHHGRLNNNNHIGRHAKLPSMGAPGEEEQPAEQ